MDEERLRETDRELLRLARGAGRLRLRMGDAVEALVRRGGHRELGFATVGAYANERLSLGGRFVGDARALARRLGALPGLRGALEAGVLSWSVVELLARHAGPEDEGALLAAARGSTVREMRVWLQARKRGASRGPDGSVADAAGAAAAGGASRGTDSSGGCATGAEGLGEACVSAGPEGMQAAACGGDGAGGRGAGAGAAPMGAENEEEEPRLCTITRTVRREDAWALEASRMLIEQMLGGAKGAAWLDALLAEGHTSLMSLARPGTDLVPADVAEEHAARLEELEAAMERRKEAEVRAERRLDRRRLAEVEPGEAPEEVALPETALGLDRHLRALASELGSRDLFLGRVLSAFFAADGPRRLGYASDTQYARERLGMARSAVWKRIRLARSARKGGLDQIEEALQEGRIGLEAAALLTRVVRRRDQAAWVARAEVRTFKHLREEVELTELVARMAGPHVLGSGPPSEDDVEAYFAFERDVLSGAILRGAVARARGTASGEASGHGDANEAQCAGPSPPMPDTRRGSVPMSGGHGETASGHLASVPMSGGRGGEGSNQGAPFPVFGVGPDQKTGRGASVRMSGGRGEAASGHLASVPMSGDLDVVDAAALAGSIVERPIEAGAGAEDTEGGGGGRGRDVAGRGAPGRVTVRLRMREDVALYFRQLEESFMAAGFPQEEFIPFLCVSFWSTWVHALGKSDRWESIYRRERYECSSPVCPRRETTLHHLVFRARGGTDDPENLVAPCFWCHLEGIHGGRIRAYPPATEPRWLLGRTPILEILGRDKRLLDAA